MEGGREGGRERERCVDVYRHMFFLHYQPVLILLSCFMNITVVGGKGEGAVGV